MQAIPNQPPLVDNYSGNSMFDCRISSVDWFSCDLFVLIFDCFLLKVADFKQINGV